MALRSSLAIAAFATLFFASSLAHADETAPEAAPAPLTTWERRTSREMETRWYGWQTLMADGASLLVLPVVAGSAEAPAIGGVAIGGYFLAAPIIHAGHGRWGTFAGSLGLRIGMPLALGVAGALVDGDCRGDFCLPVAAALGVALGALGAVAIDAAVLSYEQVDPNAAPGDEASRRKPRAIAWSPSIAPRKEGGVTLGLGATF